MPPDNAEDFNKLFDEYECDIAADLERIQFDQKVIDALDKQLEEELKFIEEESKKDIESKPNDSNRFDAGCFSPSISVQQGRGVSEKLVPRALKKQY